MSQRDSHGGRYRRGPIDANGGRTTCPICGEPVPHERKGDERRCVAEAERRIAEIPGQRRPQT